MLFAKVSMLLLAFAGVLIGIHVLTNSLVMGIPRVLDGDTLDVAGRQIHLYGIDAPELRQTCAFSGRSWACGQRAAQALAEYLGRGRVTCRKKVESLGQWSAVCYKSSIDDIAAHQMKHGWAVAAVQESDDYVSLGQVAQAQLKGIWSSVFALPWTYRESHSTDLE